MNSKIDIIEEQIREIVKGDSYAQEPINGKCECQPKSEPLAHEFLSHSCS